MRGLYYFTYVVLSTEALAKSAVLTRIIENNIKYLDIYSAIQTNDCEYNVVRDLLPDCEMNPQLHIKVAIGLSLCEFTAANVAYPSICALKPDSGCTAQLVTVPQWWSTFTENYHSVDQLCHQHSNKHFADKFVALQKNTTSIQKDILEGLDIFLSELESRQIHHRQESDSLWHAVEQLSDQLDQMVLFIKKSTLENQISQRQRQNDLGLLENAISNISHSVSIAYTSLSKINQQISAINDHVSSLDQLERSIQTLEASQRSLGLSHQSLYQNLMSSHVELAQLNSELNEAYQILNRTLNSQLHLHDVTRGIVSMTENVFSRITKVTSYLGFFRYLAHSRVLLIIAGAYFIRYKSLVPYLGPKSFLLITNLGSYSKSRLSPIEDYYL